MGGAGRIGAGEHRHRLVALAIGELGGSCASACSSTVTWSAAVFEPAFPGRSSPARCSPVSSRKQCSGWKPKPPLRCGPPPSFSVWHSNNCASKSSVTDAGRTPNDQARSRALRRAARIDASSSSPSAYNSRVAVAVRRDLPEQVRLLGKRAQIGDTVAAIDQHRRQINQHPPRPVQRAPLEQLRKPGRKLPLQPQPGRQLGHQHRARARDQTLAISSDLKRSEPAARLHSQGASSLCGM